MKCPNGCGYDLQPVDACPCAADGVIDTCDRCSDGCRKEVKMLYCQDCGAFLPLDFKGGE